MASPIVSKTCPAGGIAARKATDGGAQTNDGFPVTLGQARRHIEILHALRTQRELASTSPRDQASGTSWAKAASSAIG
jgi:hypothetical protein